MRQYSNYKSTGINWIGNIPDHWEQCRLKNFCSLKGRIGWKGLRSDEFQTDSYAYLVTGQDFDGSVIPWKNCYQIDKERYDEDPYIQLQNGDLLITKDGTIGKVAKVTGLDKPACLNSGIFVLKQKKDVFNQDYLYWVMISNMLTEFNNYTSSGTTILHLYQNVFENMPLLVPPIDEQISIASFLNKRCNDIDKIVATQQKRIDLLQELKNSEIKHFVTRGLNTNALLVDSKVDWIGKIPQEWEAKKIKYCFDIYAGATPKTDNPENWDGDIIWVTPADYKTVDKYIHEGQRTLTKKGYDSCNTQIVPKGSIIFSKRAPIGTVAINDVDLCTNQGCLSCVPKGANSLYYYYVMSIATEQFDLLGSGATFKEISADSFANVKLPYPPIEEQKAIAIYLDNRCGEIDKQIQAVSKQIDLLKEYKQSLIYEAVTGKRKVC